MARDDAAGPQEGSLTIALDDDWGIGAGVGGDDDGGGHRVYPR